MPEQVLTQETVLSPGAVPTGLDQTTVIQAAQGMVPTALTQSVQTSFASNPKLPLYIGMGVLGWVVMRNKLAFLALAGLGYYYYKKTSVK